MYFLVLFNTHSLTWLQRIVLSQPARGEQPRVPPVDGETYQAGGCNAFERFLLSDAELALIK